MLKKLHPSNIYNVPLIIEMKHKLFQGDKLLDLYFGFLSLPQHKFVIIFVEQHYLSLNTVTCLCPFIESNLDKSVSI